MFAETIAKVARTMRLLIIEDDRDALVALTLATDYACRPLRHTWILESAEEHDR